MIQFADQMAHARFDTRPKLFLLDRIALDKVIHRHFEATDFHHQVVPHIHRCKLVAAIHDTPPFFALHGMRSNRRAIA